MSRRLTKQERVDVYNKYNGHCAYCGEKIEYKDMQVDHLIPLRNWDKSHTEEELWNFSNLMPSCRSCNHYKRANDVETFRKKIETIPKKLFRDNYLFKVAVKYDIFEDRECEVLFYFEIFHDDDENDWKYAKPLHTSGKIHEFEKLVRYTFPEDFVKCVLHNNGGRPRKRAFKTDKDRERELKTFLSFNEEDRETVWKIFEWSKKELSNKYIPFAIDHFDNLICFNAENDSVVFFEHENQSIEKIADDFNEFLDSLYE